MILAAPATPATPMPLLVRAAAVPATAVPWPHTSAGVGIVAVACCSRHQVRSFRSGWSALTPVSRIGDRDAAALGAVPGGGGADFADVPFAADVGIVDRQRAFDPAVQFGELEFRVAAQLLDDRSSDAPAGRSTTCMRLWPSLRRLPPWALTIFSSSASGQAGARFDQDAAACVLLRGGRWVGLQRSAGSCQPGWRCSSIAGGIS